MKRIAWSLVVVLTLGALGAASSAAPQSSGSAKSPAAPASSRMSVDVAPMFKNLLTAIQISSLDDASVSKLTEVATRLQAAIEQGPAGADKARKALNEIGAAVKKGIGKTTGHVEGNPAEVLRVRSLMDIVAAARVIAESFGLKADDLPELWPNHRCQVGPGTCVPAPRKRCMQVTPNSCVST